MLADLAPDFPPNLTIFEVCVSHGDVTAFVPWTDIMNKYTYSKEEPYFNILVPTGETTCYNWLLQTLVGAGQHTMIIGETGLLTLTLTRTRTLTRTLTRTRTRTRTLTLTLTRRDGHGQVGHGAGLPQAAARERELDPGRLLGADERAQHAG